MKQSLLNEELNNLKYLMGYKRGVVLSEQPEPTAGQPAANAATPDKASIKSILDSAKEVSKQYKRQNRLDGRNKRRLQRSDKKTCSTLRRGISVVTPTDTASLTELCPVLFDCIADKNIEATFKFPACDAYKAQAASSSETAGAGGTAAAGTPGLPTADRATETECIKKYKWFTPNNVGMWEEDKITYKGKNAKGEEIIFTYKPEGTYMGTVENSTTKAKKYWECGTATPEAKPAEVPTAQPTAQQQKLGLA